MVFNDTFNNISVISWWSVLLVEETGVPRENHRPAASHLQTSSHFVVSSTPRLIESRSRNVSGVMHCLHSYLYIKLPYDHDPDGPNNSFGVDQKLKMAICLGQSLHYSLMEIHYHLSMRH